MESKARSPTRYLALDQRARQILVGSVRIRGQDSLRGKVTKVHGVALAGRILWEACRRTGREAHLTTCSLEAILPQQRLGGRGGVKLNRTARSGDTEGTLVVGVRKWRSTKRARWKETHSRESEQCPHLNVQWVGLPVTFCRHRELGPVEEMAVQRERKFVWEGFNAVSLFFALSFVRRSHCCRWQATVR